MLRKNEEQTQSYQDKMTEANERRVYGDPAQQQLRQQSYQTEEQFQKPVYKEIKSPISRTLDYSVPTSYWCQMQLQAEVCDVDVVEYVEIKFEAAPLNKETETFLKNAFLILLME